MVKNNKDITAHEKLKSELREALQEMKDAKEGKIKLMTAEELYKELEALEQHVGTGKPIRQRT